MARVGGPVAAERADAPAPIAPSGKTPLAAAVAPNLSSRVMCSNSPERKGRSMRRLVAAVCLAGIAAGPAWADVMIERFSRSDGVGGVGAFENSSVQATAATAQREENHRKFTGGFMSAIAKMAGMGDSIRIVRLDRDVVWTL